MPFPHTDKSHGLNPVVLLVKSDFYHSHLSQARSFQSSNLPLSNSSHQNPTPSPSNPTTNYNSLSSLFDIPPNLAASNLNRIRMSSPFCMVLSVFRFRMGRPMTILTWQVFHVGEWDLKAIYPRLWFNSLLSQVPYSSISFCNSNSNTI